MTDALAATVSPARRALHIAIAQPLLPGPLLREQAEVDIFHWHERKPDELPRFKSGQLQLRQQRLQPRSA